MFLFFFSIPSHHLNFIRGKRPIFFNFSIGIPDDLIFEFLFIVIIDSVTSVNEAIHIIESRVGPKNRTNTIESPRESVLSDSYSVLALEICCFIEEDGASAIQECGWVEGLGLDSLWGVCVASIFLVYEKIGWVPTTTLRLAHFWSYVVVFPLRGLTVDLGAILCAVP